MTPLKFIAGFFLLAFTACEQSGNRLENKNLLTQNSYPSYIVFGLFCSECVGHCATMYRYNMMGNSNTLLVDTTDSYFKNGGQIIWKTQITDKAFTGETDYAQLIKLYGAPSGEKNNTEKSIARQNAQTV